MKNKLLFYIFKYIAILSRLVNYKWYMKLIVKAHQSKGVKFDGEPRYVEDYSIMVGNPAKKVGLTNQEYGEK